MYVSIKTLEGKLFKVEAAPEASIGDVKKLIAESHAEMPAASMKRIPAPLKKEEVGWRFRAETAFERSVLI